MMRIRNWLAFALTIVLTSGTLATVALAKATEPEKRVALVVGNSAYRYAVSLPNPVKDARLISATLRASGFEVIEGLDADKATLKALVDQFTEAAYGADLGMIYYAGHGLQVDGKNFLIPVDAELTSPAHLLTRAVEVNDLIKTLPPDPAVGIVILDACRDNPLARTLAASLPASRSNATGVGLAPVQTPVAGNGAGGILIAYATDPGAVALDGKGENSPYTTALAKHIAAPGLDIQSALTRVRGEVAEATSGKQRPWHNASLGREVFIGGPPVQEPEAQSSKAAPAEASAAPTAGVDNEMLWEEERRFFDEAAKRDSIPHYEAYLKRYPNGRLVEVARLNMAAIEAKSETKVASAAPEASPVIEPSSQARVGVSVPQQVREEVGTAVSEAALGLNHQARVDLQLRLAAAGFEVGGIDGDIGRKSRSAIGQWQRQQKMMETAFLTSNQYAQLVAQTDPMMPAIRAEYETKQVAVQAERAEKERTQRVRAQRQQQKEQARGQSASGSKRDTRSRSRTNPRDVYVVRRQPNRNGEALGTVLFGVALACKLANRC